MTLQAPETGTQTPTVTAAETAIRDARALLERYPVAQTDDRTLRGARFEAGLAFPHFGVGFGGRGLEPAISNVI